MEIENLLIRYAPRAIVLKPSASQGEARLRGLWRVISSKTISPRLSRAKPPARNANSNGDPIAYRLSPIGYRLSTIGYRRLRVSA
jgi:hypothetical protein